MEAHELGGVAVREYPAVRAHRIERAVSGPDGPLSMMSRILATRAWLLTGAMMAWSIPRSRAPRKIRACARGQDDKGCPFPRRPHTLAEEPPSPISLSLARQSTRWGLEAFPGPDVFPCSLTADMESVFNQGVPDGASSMNPDQDQDVISVPRFHCRHGAGLHLNPVR